MGFEDDMDYNDDFETDTIDPDSDSFSEKPKKMNRKDFRRAKKKTAEKNADSTKSKKGLFIRHGANSDDENEELTDDAFNSLSDNDEYDSQGTIKSSHSEFGYLFDPPREGESEDDVYPDSSIYSDSSAAKEMLGGLEYDGYDDADSSKFDKYFDNPTETRPPSQFSFNNRDNDFSLPGGLNTPIGSAPPTPSPITLDSAAAPVSSADSSEDKPDSYLPDLRSDSVFINRDERQPTPTRQAAETSTPDQKNATESSGAAENPPKEDTVTPTESLTQEFLPYGGMYPSYPMNPMVNYPVVLPGGTQPQGAQYQTIPIPYPMPMPMPMYNQYPQYMPQPQYVILPQLQPQPQQPPQPQPQPRQQYGGGDDYGRQRRRDDYDGGDDLYDRYDLYDDDYDDRRRSRGRRRDDRYYDDRDRRDRRDRDYRRDSEYDDRYNERAAARYYDERRGRYERRSDRYYDRIDARSYSDGKRAERKTYPKAPYEPPYPQQDPDPIVDPIVDPIAKSAAEPIKSAPEPIKTESSAPKVDPSPIIQNKPMTAPASQPQQNNNLMSGFDAAFDSPFTDGFGFDVNSFGMNSFGSDVFDPNASYPSEDDGFDEFSGDTTAGTKFNRH